MRNKKILCTALTSLFCFVNFINSGVNALFGNTHYNLGKIIVEKSKIELLESEREAFLSGIVYADIGRIKFDKETGIDSDSDKFVNEMKRFAETSEEKWFIKGWEMHIFQDKETLKFLKEIFSGHEYSSYMQYIVDCGTLDSYFLKKSGIIHNEFLDRFNFEQVTDLLNIEDLNRICGTSGDEIKDLFRIILRKYSGTMRNNLIMYDSLVKKTYESFGFEVSVDQIREQAGNLFGAFIIVASIILEKVVVSETLSSKIEEKYQELADLCVSELKIMEE